MAAAKKSEKVAGSKSDNEYTPEDVMGNRAPTHIMLRYAALALIDPGPNGFIATGPDDPRLRGDTAATNTARQPKEETKAQVSLTPTEIRPGFFLYTLEQTCAVLQISRSTLFTLEQDGLISSHPDIRHKRYAVEEVSRFASRKAKKTIDDR